MSRTVKDPEERRLELMQAALELFQQRGYDATSVQAITDRVGVAKGLFYHYFKSQEDLLDQLGDWQADRMYAAVEQAAAAIEGNPLYELSVLVKMLLEWKFGEMREVTIAYARMMYAPHNVALRAKVFGEYLERMVPHVRELLAEGVELGQMHVADVDATTEIIMALWHGYGERVGPALLHAVDAPEEGTERLFAIMRAFESALERICGAAPGSIVIYDYEYLAAGLAETTAPSTAPLSASPTASTQGE